MVRARGSGLKTLDWRSEWEATRDASLKQKLLTYNAQDCQAAQRVAETLEGICSNDPSMQPETVGVNSLECDHHYGLARCSMLCPTLRR
jgi:hypothetical protein